MSLNFACAEHVGLRSALFEDYLELLALPFDSHPALAAKAPQPGESVQPSMPSDEAMEPPAKRPRRLWRRLRSRLSAPLRG